MPASSVRRGLTTAALAAAAFASAAPVAGALTIEPPFNLDYTATSLGTPADVPTNLGGLVVKAGDADTIIIGGAANGASGALYEVPVTRGADGHITGFAGPGVKVADARNIDGGLAYGPNGVLFTSLYPDGDLGQIKPGSLGLDKIIDLNAAPLSVSGSVGALGFTPPGFGGAGSLKIAPYNGTRWYDADIVPDGTGTFNVTNVAPRADVGNDNEGLAYVEAGSPRFANPAILLTKYGAGKVVTYEADADGDPIPTTQRSFITGLTGAEGAAIDPITGDYLFSTFGGGNQVIVVKGFTSPSPCARAGAILGDSGPNTLNGTPGDDVICGFGGNDSIDGKGGDDIILGGEGNDTVLDGPGNDTVSGEGGNDVFGAGAGTDSYTGGPGTDRVSYATRTDPINAEIGRPNSNGTGADNDAIAADVEELNGGSDDDILTGNDSANTIRGGGGTDAIEGRGGRDALRGNDGNDTLRGEGGDDVLEGGAGGDLLEDGGGSDVLYGGPGDDEVLSSADGAGDYLFCDTGADGFLLGESLDRANRNCESPLLIG